MHMLYKDTSDARSGTRWLFSGNFIFAISIADRPAPSELIWYQRTYRTNLSIMTLFTLLNFVLYDNFSL